MEQILGSFPLLAGFQIPAMVLLHMFDPTSAVYLSSLIFKDGDNYNIFIHAISLCLETFTYVSVWGTIVFVICFHYTYLRHVICWVMNIR